MEHDAQPTTGADETPDAAPAPGPVALGDEVLAADEALVPETELLAALRARHAVLESRLARAEEENVAFVRSLRHAAAAAEELLAEATAEADAVRAAAAVTAEEVLAAAGARAAALVDAATAQAAEIVDAARTEAHAAQADERRAIDESRAALGAIEASIAADRAALVRHHAELTAGLRALARAMGLAADEPPTAPVLPAAPVVPVFAVADDAAGFADTVRTGPVAGAAPVDAEVAAVDDGSAPPDPTRRSEAYPAHDEEHLERAFDEFFSSEIEHEPSRAWIFEE